MSFKSTAARAGLVLTGAILVGLLCWVFVTAWGNRGSGAAWAAAGTASTITALNLQVSITPGSIYQGEDAQVAASLSITGGPGPVTLAFTAPKSDGGTYNGSVTVMLDRNATYAFDLPMTNVNWDPDTYTYTVRATAGRLSVTRSATLVVLPPYYP